MNQCSFSFVIPRCKGVLIVHGTYAEVDVVKQGRHKRQDHVGISFVEVLEPPDAGSGQVIVLIGDLANAEDHDDEDGNLDDVVEVECYQVCIRLLRVVVYRGCCEAQALEKRELGVFEEIDCQSNVGGSLPHLIYEDHLSDHQRGK